MHSPLETGPSGGDPGTLEEPGNRHFGRVFGTGGSCRKRDHPGATPERWKGRAAGASGGFLAPVVGLATQGGRAIGLSVQ